MFEAQETFKPLSMLIWKSNFFSQPTTPSYVSTCGIDENGRQFS